MSYNILKMTDRGETKFLSKLFTTWTSEENRNDALTFDEDQVEYLIPLLKSENDNFIIIAHFPTRLKWESGNGNLY